MHGLAMVVHHRLDAAVQLYLSEELPHVLTGKGSGANEASRDQDLSNARICRPLIVFRFLCRDPMDNHRSFRLAPGGSWDDH